MYPCAHNLCRLTWTIRRNESLKCFRIIIINYSVLCDCFPFFSHVFVCLYDTAWLPSTSHLELGSIHQRKPSRLFLFHSSMEMHHDILLGTCILFARSFFAGIILWRSCCSCLPLLSPYWNYKYGSHRRATRSNLPVAIW